MTIEQAFDALRVMVTGDAAIAALLGAAVQVIEGNAPIETIPPQKLPAAVFEAGDGETGGIPIGVSSQELGPDFLLGFLWHETSVATAFRQRLGLPELVSQMMQRNPTLGIPGAAAWLADWAPDRGANHPKQRWQCTIATVIRVAA